MVKVFGLGYPRTGTTSLCQVLSRMYYRTLHDAYDEFPKAYICGDLSTSKEFDASVNCYQTMYKEFDRQYPDSKFILTCRDEEDWIKSIKGHRKQEDIEYVMSQDSFLTFKDFSHLSTAIYMELFGCIGFNKDLFLDKYRCHNEDVVEYFGERVLVLNLGNENHTERLFEFLEYEGDYIEWPHLHKTSLHPERHQIKRKPIPVSINSRRLM